MCVQLRYCRDEVNNGPCPRCFLSCRTIPSSGCGPNAPANDDRTSRQQRPGLLKTSQPGINGFLSIVLAIKFCFPFFSSCGVVNSRPAALLSSLPSSNAKDAIERAHNLRFLGGREKVVQEAIFLAGIQGPVEGAAPTCADSEPQMLVETIFRIAPFSMRQNRCNCIQDNRRLDPEPWRRHASNTTRAAAVFLL
jgi:hypothetical protein